MAGNGRFTTILLFEAFEKALMQFMHEDAQVLLPGHGPRRALHTAWPANCNGV